MLLCWLNIAYVEIGCNLGLPKPSLEGKPKGELSCNSVLFRAVKKGDLPLHGLLSTHNAVAAQPHPVAQVAALVDWTSLPEQKEVHVVKA